MLRHLITATAITICAGAHADLALPSAFAGSDGAFSPTANVTVDLSLAQLGDWQTTGGNGAGVYDAAQWAVIYRFTEMNIPANVKVDFKNHPSGAPVIVLVDGDATINGEISLDGAAGHGNSATPTTSLAGAGGFRGGRGDAAGVPGCAGFGPGGGPRAQDGGSGSYGTAGTRGGETYGNPGLFPLIGGSGGGTDTIRLGGPGGGGGAILIAAAGSITLGGSIHANGGNGFVCGGNGSGGGIRLVADTITGNGSLSAVGGSSGCAGVGGAGRIRVEANTNNLVTGGVPPFTGGLPGDTPRIFRDVDSDNVPVIRAVTMGSVPVPQDPRPTQVIPPDVVVPDPGTQTLNIEALFVPEGSVVTVRVVPASGNEQEYQATFAGAGDQPDETLWTAEVDLAGGFSNVQVHAALVD